jgi:hypothetical protein
LTGGPADRPTGDVPKIQMQSFRAGGKIKTEALNPNQEGPVKINDYFKTAKGRGVLATADSSGKVDVAVYTIPHVIDEGTVAFIMPDKLTHVNLQSNPHAAYLFTEEEEKFKGVRLFLTKVKEEKDGQKIEEIRRREYPQLKGKEYLVYFRVDKVLPLIGAGTE